jgi:hypothetical protein
VRRCYACGTVRWPGRQETRDIDFLGRMENSPEAVAAMVRECLAVESADGLEFSPDVAVEPITIEDRYPGVRALIETRLAGARRLCPESSVNCPPGWLHSS